MSSNGNANYTHIQAHGTAGAYEPGFIAQAASVGPHHGPVLPAGSPYRVVDVNIDLVGSSAGDLLVLGDSVPPGCIITDVTMNGADSLEVGVEVTVGLGEPVAPATAPTVFASVQAGTPATVPGVPGVDLNGGQAFVGVDALVPVPAVVGQPLYPVLQVTTPVTDPMVAGSVSVKVVYFCP